MVILMHWHWQVIGLSCLESLTFYFSLSHCSSLNLRLITAEAIDMMPLAVSQARAEPASGR